MELFIISGTSGAGKSIALDALEDLGFYCIDNLPISVIPAFIDDAVVDETDAYEHIAIGLDARNLHRSTVPFSEIMQNIADHGIETRIFFLDTNDAVLIKRFSETRRKHPLSEQDPALDDAIINERIMLQPIAALADVTIDTSRTNVHQLRDLVRKHAGRSENTSMSILFESFGFKYGLPIEADYVFDVRCLPNPHWEPKLRPLTGRDKEIVHYLENHFEVNRMFDDIQTFLSNWIPSFQQDKRSYLTIATGCTGGQHRSVYFTERLANYFSEQGYRTLIRHREL